MRANGENFRGALAETQQVYVKSSLAGSMMREVMHTLGNIDFEHQLELSRLEADNTNRDLRSSIRSELLARHCKRREPYLELLAMFRRQQHRCASAA